MQHERTLRITLGLVGLIFMALVYPMFVFAREDPALAMMLSLYVTLGVFLLLAIRNPAEHRSLIAFTAWSSLVHAVVMGTQVFLHMVGNVELPGVIVLAIIGIALIALAPSHRIPASA